MKKLLLTTAAATILAASTTFAAEGQFYVKGNVGVAKMSDTKIKVKSLQIATTTFKSKSKNIFSFGIGAGSYITNDIRMDAAFDRISNVVYKSNKTISGTTLYPVKVDINALTVNGYYDLFDISNIKLFAGAGLGISSFSAKTKFTTTRYIHTAKFTTNSFTYALHLGASTQIVDNLHAELAYSWKDYGTVKNKGKLQEFKMPLKGHHVTLGLRYDI